MIYYNLSFMKNYTLMELTLLKYTKNMIPYNTPSIRLAEYKYPKSAKQLNKCLIIIKI